MKKTGSLKISISAALGQTSLVMHPNEGFDLGLLRLEHPVQLCRGIGVEEYLKGGVGVCEMVDIALLNNCPKETLLVGKTLYRLLGEPSKAVVLFDGHRLFIHKA